MKRKNLFLILIFTAFVIAVGLASYQKRVSKQPQEFYQSRINTKQIERIQFEKVGFGSAQNAYVLITLVKAKVPGTNQWRIPELSNAEVDSAKMERLLSSVATLRGKLTGQSPDDLSQSDLKANEAFRVTFFDGNWNELSSLLIGAERKVGGILFKESADRNIYATQDDLLAVIGIKDPRTDKPSYDFWISKGSRAS